jgi:hypothetical protein
MGPEARVARGTELELEATRGAAPAGWDDAVIAAGGIVFHGTPWAKVIEAHGAEPWFLQFRSHGDVAGYAIAEALRSRLPVLGRRRSSLSLETTPLLARDASLVGAVEATRAFGRRARLGRLQCLSYAALLPEATAELAQLGLTVRPRLEFRIPLGANLADTLGGMSSGHRRNIRKAMDDDFSLREDSTVEGAMLLRRLQDTTYGRRHEQGNVEAQPLTPAYYRTTMEAYLATGTLRVWLVERSGDPLSALGILIYGPRAYYLVGGTSEEGYKCRAAFAAFGHVIEALCAAGVVELHLGGTPSAAETEGHPDHGLYRFKKGFGTEPVTCWDASGRM